MTLLTALPPPAVRPPDAVRPAVDGRPPGRRWARPWPPPPTPQQPMLDLGAGELTGPPEVGPVPTLTACPAWLATPDPALPDAARWSLTLAQAVVEVLQGRRGPGQLSRWVDEPVLASVSVLCRRRSLAVRLDPPNPERAVPPPVQLRSVRVQHPTPYAAEVAVLAQRGRRCTAMAFRLEAQQDRWLCVALELGPRPPA